MRLIKSLIVTAMHQEIFGLIDLSYMYTRYELVYTLESQRVSAVLFIRIMS